MSRRGLLRLLGIATIATPSAGSPVKAAPADVTLISATCLWPSPNALAALGSTIRRTSAHGLFCGSERR